MIFVEQIELRGHVKAESTASRIDDRALVPLFQIINRKHGFGDRKVWNKTVMEGKCL